MLREFTQPPPPQELTVVLDAVQTSGAPAIVFPSSGIGDLETVTRETQRRRLRIAGVPRGGYTILPAIPLDDSDLLHLCERYCTRDPEERAAIREQLYTYHYPLFEHHADRLPPLFHPAEYITRILNFCLCYVQAPDADVAAWPSRIAFLHITPVKEICSYLRGELKARARPPEDAQEVDGSLLQLRLHAEEDVQRLRIGGHTPPPVASPETDTVVARDVDVFFQAEAVEAGSEASAEAEPEDLTGEEVVDAVHGFQSEYLVMDGYELVERMSIFYDREGEMRRVAAVYVPGAIPREMCIAAAQVLEPAASRHNLRAATNGGVPPDTGIVGYYDYLTNPTPHKCRETEFTRKNWEALASCTPFLQHLDAIYSQMAPTHHHLQKVAIPSQFQLCNTAFSTVTVNRNFRTAVHTDKGDFKSGLGLVAVINGKFEGCHLAVKKIKKAFRLGIGDVLLFDTSLEHGNTELEGHRTEWSRTSVVCYLRTGLMSSVCELERRKHLNRVIMQQLQGTAVRDSAVNINAGDTSLPPLFVPVRLASRLAPVQLSALGFIVERAEKKSGCVVAMTMGLGKTLVALTLCFSHLHQRPKDDILILTPKAIINHWVDESKKWAQHGLQFIHLVASDGLNNVQYENQLLGYSRQLRNEQARYGHIFVLNSERLSGFTRRFRSFRPSLMIIDEGHRIAAKGSKLMESLDQLQCPLRVILSGTPLQNDATELYRLVCWVNKAVCDVMPPRRFQELASDINRFIGGDDSAFYAAVMAQTYIQDWMCGFVFREMENDLPPLHDYLLICGSSDVQREYEDQLGLYAATVSSLPATEHRPLHLSTHPSCYLAFISGTYQSMLGSGAARPREEERRSAILDNRDTIRLEQYYQMVNNEQLDTFIGASGKIRVLADIVRRVQAKKEKVIIFSLYVGSQDFIHRVLTALRISAFTVRGRDSQERRRSAIERFNSDADLVALVLSTKIAAYGLDFTAANHVVLFDSWWNPQVDAQAIARAYRRNQQKPVTVYRLISPTENRSVLQAQTRKIALFRCLLHERTSRSALPEELEDCADSEKDEERRAFWQRLKSTPLSGGTFALRSVYSYQESVRDSQL